MELPEGLLGEDETFSIETVFETTTKANHWLYTIGNIVDGANYLFVNPMDPNGNMLAAVRESVMVRNRLAAVMEWEMDRNRLMAVRGCEMEGNSKQE